MAKKYLSLDRLTEYDALLKSVINSGDEAVKSYVNEELAKKASESHTHDDRYYTETEIDTKISGVNTSITNIVNGTTTVKKAENATNATSADSAKDANKLGGQSPSYYAKASDIPTGALAKKNVVSETDLDSALATKVNAAAEGNHSHSNKSVLDGITSAKVAAWDTSLDDAKAYTDGKTAGMATTTGVSNSIAGHNTATNAHNDIRDLISELTTKVNNFLDVDDTKTDQLSEILELIANNKGTLDSITSSKVNVSDIVNNLTTASATKVLSANQGVVLKGLIDALQETVDGKAAGTHTHTIAQVTNLQSTLNAKASQTDLDALESVVAGKADTGHVHTIANVTGLQAALDSKDEAIEAAKSEAANQAAVVLAQAQLDARTYTDSVASGKADKTHGHEIADVTGLQTALDGKANSSHGTHVTWSTTSPKMNGTAAVGSETKVARGDHVHPVDTSRASKSEFDSHDSNTTKHITSTERTNWGTAYTHSQAAHAPSNAQANVIESIKVNGTAQTITSKAVNITVPTKASDINAAESTHKHAISDITDLSTTLSNAASAIGSNTSSINALTDRTKALEDKVGDGFEEISSAEISALFAV